MKVGLKIATFMQLEPFLSNFDHPRDISTITTIIYWIIFVIVFGHLNVLFVMLFLSTKSYRTIITFGFLIWNFFMSFYLFEIFPGSKNYFAEERIKRITGQKLNVTSTYCYDEFGGFTGDGYSLYFYDLQKVIIIDTLLLKKFPTEERNWITLKWKETPMNIEDSLFLDHHLETNLYNNKESLKLQSIYSFIRKSSFEKGNYYTFSEIKNRGIEIGFLSGHDKKFFYLNSMW